MRTTAVLLLSTFAISVSAQENREAPLYRLEFNIHDGSDAAAKTGRRYTMLVEATGKGTFRAGNKVPYITGAASNTQGPQYNYAEVGVNIDARLRDISGRIYLSADLDVSTVLPREKDAAPNPTIASIHISVNTIMSPGKPALVAYIDDPVIKRRFDIEATVTKVD